jgi:hypothetical protein
MPYILAFSLFMIFAGLTLPRTSSRFEHVSNVPISYKISLAYSLFYFNVFWLCLVITSLIYILGHGVEYVAWPRLIPPTDFLMYEGPGFRSGNKGKGFKIPFNLDRRLVKGGIRIGGVYSNLSHRYSKTEEIEMGLKKRTE